MLTYFTQLHQLVVKAFQSLFFPEKFRRSQIKLQMKIGASDPVAPEPLAICLYFFICLYSCVCRALILTFRTFSTLSGNSLSTSFLSLLKRKGRNTLWRRLMTSSDSSSFKRI